MKCLLQTLVTEIAEVHLKTTFPTSCRGLARCDNREDHQISQTRRAATYDAPWSFLFSTQSSFKNIHITGSLSCLSKKGNISFSYTLLAHGEEATLKSILIKKKQLPQAR